MSSDPSFSEGLYRDIESWYVGSKDSNYQVRHDLEYCNSIQLLYSVIMMDRIGADRAVQILFPFPDLLPPHRIIQAFFRQQVFVLALFDHFALFEDIDLIGMHDGG